MHVGQVKAHMRSARHLVAAKDITEGLTLALQLPDLVGQGRVLTLHSLKLLEEKKWL